MRSRLPAAAALVALLAALPAAAKPPAAANNLPEPLKSKMYGMRGFPDAATVKDPAKYFPLVDRFGQYAHKDWPGKIHTVEDFARHKRQEAADLAAHPGPADWDAYGGWLKGPALKGTGHFRVEKREGRWWLVDPDGRLFWSHGVDSVRSGNATTPITDRRHWFDDLPAKGSPLAQFYGRGNWAPRGYYHDKHGYETYNFSAANLLRKYGDGWRQEFGPLVQRRLRSWGLNTIANWSEPEVYRLRKTPYTPTLGVYSRPLAGSEGFWHQFADVFDPSFAAKLREAMAKEKDTSARDPWCLGYFIDNELSWGNETSLAMAALASPAEQPAKRVFVEDLKKKYGTIEKLNAAWQTKHASWDALLTSQKPPDAKKAHDDLAAFYTKTAERYFQTCRDAVKEVAPQKLYLGCRFAWTNDRAVRAAAKYCDVISFNRYQADLAKFHLPDGVDKPTLIGEFHFGALDRGLFHTGLVPTRDQHARAEAYKSYVRSALDHPNFVGTHWFEYADQPLTGRGDGENYQIGLVDVGDTPYAETIAAIREMGSELYARRAK